MSRLNRGVRAAALTAVLGVALAGVPGSAQAAKPTKLSDSTSSARCSYEGADGTSLDVHVDRSSLAGASLRASRYDEEGFVGEGSGSVTWTDTSFRGEVTLTDDDGRDAGRVTVSGTYRKLAGGDRNVRKFNDGNTHVVEDHTYGTAEVTGVVMALDGSVLTGVECDGYWSTGYLFVSNPSVRLYRYGLFRMQECEVDNVSDFFTEGGPSEFAFGFEYADPAGATAWSPQMDLTRGPWTGDLVVFDETSEEPGFVRATASLEQSGPVVRMTDKVGKSYQRVEVTPYTVVIEADGPAGPARISCSAADLQYLDHVSSH